MKLEYHRGEPVPQDAQYLTFRKWTELMVKQVMEEYECDREGALMCLGVKRWADYHILPLVQAGVQPSHTIIKSIHKVCNHGYINYLRREFLVATHGDGELIPTGYDLEGKKIPYTFRISTRRSQTGGKA